MAEIQYFELDNKFWEIQIEGSTTATRYGKLGSNGQTKAKEHPTEAKARAFFDKTITQKTKKGYEEADRPEDGPETLLGDAPAPKKTRKRAAPTKAAAPAKRTKRTAGGSGALDGMVFCMTGTLSEKRASVKAKIESAGGVIASSLTKKVTHLLMGESGEGTSKHEKAVDRGDVEIIFEDDLATMLGGSLSDAEGEPETKVSARAARAAKKANKTASVPGPLSGMTICSTGTLSKTRKVMTALIEANGGAVANTLTKKATHLLLGEGGEGTSKHEKAVDRADVQIITEDELEALIGSEAETKEAEEPEEPEEVAGDASGEDEEEEVEEEEKEASGEPLAGMVICVTGTLSAKRTVFEKKIVEFGGKIAKGVTKACTHLLMGPDGEGSSKHNKALSNGIPVWDEETFNETIGA